MKTELELTLEQQFKLKVYIEQIRLISAVEAHILLVEMIRQNMVKDHVIKNLLNPTKWVTFVMQLLLEKFLIAAIEPYFDTDNKINF